MDLHFTEMEKAEGKAGPAGCMGYVGADYETPKGMLSGQLDI